MVPTPCAHALGPLRPVELIRTRGGADACRLTIDDGASIAAAVDHVADRGRRRIAFIGADTAMSPGRGRAAAFRAARARRGLTGHPALLRTAAPGFGTGRAQMEALLDAPEPPDAVICGGFEMSNGALDACLRRGVAMPDALSFVGYGDPGAYRWIAGGITTVALMPDEIAAQAVSVLLDGEATGERVSPTRLEIRASA